MPNRLHELRQRRGLSMAALGVLVDTSASHVNKLEKGQVALTLDWIERLAGALGVRPIDVIWRDPSRELAAEAEALENVPDEAAELLDGAGRRAFHVVSRRLDNLGLVPGDLVVTAPAEATPEPGAVVVARFGTVLLLRQFLPPALLVTNSGTANLLPLDMRRERPEVLGVAVASLRLERPEHPAVFSFRPVDSNK